MKKALVLVDIQNDFIEGGALAVSDGDAVVPIANSAMEYFDIVVATQDWHPSDHGSFAIQHKDKNPGNVIKLKGLSQVLWPVHCVQGTKGAEFVTGLKVDAIHKVFRKGMDRDIDSYSGFFDNGHLKDTGLGDFLKAQKIEEIYVMGLATDYCVKFTAMDACEQGFKTFIIEDGVRGVEINKGDCRKAIQEMKDAGIKVISTSDLFVNGE